MLLRKSPGVRLLFPRAHTVLCEDSDCLSIVADVAEKFPSLLKLCARLAEEVHIGRKMLTAFLSRRRYLSPIMRTLTMEKSRDMYRIRMRAILPASPFISLYHCSVTDAVKVAKIVGDLAAEMYNREKVSDREYLELLHFCLVKVAEDLDRNRDSIDYLSLSTFFLDIITSSPPTRKIVIDLPQLRGTGNHVVLVAPVKNEEDIALPPPLEKALISISQVRVPDIVYLLLDPYMTLLKLLYLDGAEVYIEKSYIEKRFKIDIYVTDSPGTFTGQLSRHREVAKNCMLFYTGEDKAREFDDVVKTLRDLANNVLNP